MRRKTVRRIPVEKALDHLARLYTAFDVRQYAGLSHALKLGEELCTRKLTSRQAITLHYFLGNTWSNLRTLRRAGTAESWNWEQDEIEQEIINLRVALNNTEFKNIDRFRACQILTNLGNLLDHVGRFVEAQEYWNRALKIIPGFGMALGNRGSGLFNYSRVILRRHDSILMLDEAQQMLAAAGRSPMIHVSAREYFAKQQSAVTCCSKSTD